MSWLKFPNYQLAWVTIVDFFSRGLSDFCARLFFSPQSLIYVGNVSYQKSASKVWHINWENSADSSASADKTFLIKNLDEFYLVCTMSSVRNISKFYKYYGQIGYNNVVKSHSTFLKAQKPRSSKQIQKKIYIEGDFRQLWKWLW